MASDSSRIMVFRPTREEFKDFAGFIRKMEEKGAHKAGVAKVIPPKGWLARRNYDNIDLVIPAPITQVVTGKQGLFQLFNVQKKSIPFEEFKQLASSKRYKPPEEDFDELERKYWKNLTFNSPTYGADVSGSIFDEDVDEWNISRLDTILNLIDKEYHVNIEGVNTPYLYFGMWKATFAWHTEDMDLYSINYIHFGAPKTWYAIPPEHGSRLERLAAGFFPGSYQNCPQFLRHKMTIISPMMLKKFSVPFDKVTQEAGEFMITFPRGYHCGFNHGFNCAESTNFASERWINYGKKALSCHCKSDSVKICMDVFVKKFQPDQWDEYLASKSDHSDSSDSDEEVEEKRQTKIPKQEAKVAVDDAVPLAKLKKNNRKESVIPNRPSPVVSPVRSAKRQPPVTKSFTLSRTSGVRKDLASVQRSLSSRDNKSTSNLIDCLAGLWQWQQPNSELEVAFNVILSQLQPKCSICLFFAKQQVNISSYVKQHLFQVLSDIRTQNLEENKGTVVTVNQSVPLIPEICFVSEESSAESMTSWLDTHLNRETPSPLLQCESCRVMVHASCYGKAFEDGNGVDYPWYCDRCKDHVPNDARNITLNDAHCCLCKLRGGALRRTKDSWIHIGCAIVIPEVSFQDITHRDNIDISGIPQARKKLKCLHCRETTRGGRLSACTQCTSGKCAIAFHATCSVLAGGPMVAGDWPQRVEAYCDRHRRDKFKAHQRDFSEIRCGQSVIAKHKNGRYYRGSVLDMTSEELYSVTFDDGSFYDKLPPQEIQEYNAQQSDIPDGSKVHVIWNDEEEPYLAVVTGRRISVTYQVKFEDESVLGVRREDVYKEEEEIPKKVRQRMSSATETADLVKSWSAEVEGSQKRRRKENPLYLEFTS